MSLAELQKLVSDPTLKRRISYEDVDMKQLNVCSSSKAD